MISSLLLIQPTRGIPNGSLRILVRNLLHCRRWPPERAPEHAKPEPGFAELEPDAAGKAESIVIRDAVLLVLISSVIRVVLIFALVTLPFAIAHVRAALLSVCGPSHHRS